MSEKTITLDLIDPVDFFGIRDHHLDQLKKHFSKLKIIARDNTIKLLGDKGQIKAFEQLLDQLVNHYNNKGYISEEVIRQYLDPESILADNDSDSSNGLILHGQRGLLIKARTPNQLRLTESSAANDLVFAVGPAGTGKTYTAVALAVKALRNKEVKRIILTRPAVEAGENLGFLPGDLKEKLDPYLQPLYDALWDMIPSQKLSLYLEERIIEIAPLAFMRGRTLDNAFVILDEAQNATIPQMKMFLTRMGRSARFIVTGDITQIDLPKNQASGLVHALKILNNIPGIGIVNFDHSDIIRHKLITEIINAYSSKE
ncbi:MAG TPA: PhoH family protein [Bacteroidales bacterium]|jgi:phosphate starvation-inducible PhoH-like protein|nr:PhoH family protein [Bacteroidales bacterium]HNZ43461.1 PhoH family protein [Bacteroidales bacterium]HOH84214.1 PhoH family protein [Bacteroidales bacterium]HPI28964.1 PhoH family protein [Bacteroidales bacterium]